MADTSLIQLFTAALGGGFTVKLLDIWYQEFTRRKSQKQSAAEFVDRHLDPLLKSADELVGKLRALSESDFKSIQSFGVSIEDRDFASLLFLHGRFWAQVELIRREGISIAMSRDRRGAQLQSFFDCLESRRVRTIDRTLQRAIGEVFLKDGSGIGFVTFVSTYRANDDLKQWVVPLGKFLSRMRHTSERQQMLQYGVVLHALIDTLDPKHFVTRDRPSWPNKLSNRSKRDLRYRVFGVYLQFVEGTAKYLGPPKKAALKKGGGARGLWNRLLTVRSGTSVGPPLFRWHRKGASTKKYN